MAGSCPGTYRSCWKLGIRPTWRCHHKLPKDSLFLNGCGGWLNPEVACCALLGLYLCVPVGPNEKAPRKMQAPFSGVWPGVHVFKSHVGFFHRFGTPSERACLSETMAHKLLTSVCCWPCCPQKPHRKRTKESKGKTEQLGSFQTRITSCSPNLEDYMTSKGLMATYLTRIALAGSLAHGIWSNFYGSCGP